MDGAFRIGKMCAEPLLCTDQPLLVFRSSQGHCRSSLQFCGRVSFTGLRAKVATSGGLCEAEHELHVLQLSDPVSIERFVRW